MDRISLQNFAGMVPRILDGRELPENASQFAENVELSTGKLQPLKVTTPFTAMHDTDTFQLKPGIGLGDIRTIPEPVAPSELSTIRICVPDQWISVSGQTSVSWIDDNGIYQDSNIYDDDLTFKSIEYTETGFIYHGTLGIAQATFDTDRLYTVHGVNYAVEHTADTAFYGGPETTARIPSTSYPHDPQIPRFSLPITTPFPEHYDTYPTGPETDRYVYGYLTMTDVSGPVLSPTLYFDSEIYGSSVTYRFYGGVQVAVEFSCNYADPRRRYYNYAQSLVDQRVVQGELVFGLLPPAITSVVIDTAAYGNDSYVGNTGYVQLDNGSNTPEVFPYTAKNYAHSTGTWTLTVSKTLTYSYAENDTAIIINPEDAGKEGPPSELSDRIQLLPGEAVQLSTPLDNGYVANKLYRTGDSTADPRLLEQIDAESYYDTNFIGTTDVLPPFGNYQNTSLSDARARSVMHPNNFGVISDDNILYLSDIYRPWVYPEEYSIQYQSTILANPIVGRSIIVFTAGDEDAGIPAYVYRVGGWRDQTTSDELTEARPLLNALSLCKVDSALFYVSADGLMQVNEGGVRNVSTAWFSKNQWAEYAPTLMKSYVNDGMIYLTVDNSVNWRMDLNKDAAAITRFTELPTVRGDSQITWTSKIWNMGTPKRHTFVRVRAAGYPVLIEIFDGEGRIRGNVMIDGDQRQRLPKMPLYEEMYMRIKSIHRVDEVTIATNAEMLARAVEGG